MSRFDDFIDEFVFMAKSAADVASKKTGEVVEISKLKYQIKQSEWDLEKAYAKLGAIVYEAKHSNEDYNDAVVLATGEIDDLKQKVADLEETLRAYRKVKKCSKCEYSNDINAVYCVRCGVLLDEDADPESEPENGDSDEGSTDY